MKKGSAKAEPFFICSGEALEENLNGFSEFAQLVKVVETQTLNEVFATQLAGYPAIARPIALDNSASVNGLASVGVLGAIWSTISA